MCAYAHKFCHECGRPLGVRARASRTIPAMSATLQALIDFTGIALDDVGLELVTKARELVAEFDSYAGAPPMHEVRDDAIGRAEDLAGRIRTYRAEVLAR